MTDQNNNINTDTNAVNQELFPEEVKNRAREFFAKGADVAYALNYDYAIELYLEGIALWPEAVEEGHTPLRQIALDRQASGKKKGGFRDSSKFKKMAAKTPLDNMLKAEYSLSKDPHNIDLMKDFTEAATEANFRQTAKWIADITLETNRQKDKPSFRIYLFLRDCYAKIEVFSRALQSCQLALLLKPNDAALQDSMRDLSAQTTMQQGNYDNDSDFRSSIKDIEQQQQQQARDQLVQSVETRTDTIKKARAEYEAEPNVPGKITKLVAALCATEKLQNENEAIEILEKAHQELGQFAFRQKIGEIRIKQWNRQARKIQAKLNQNPDDEKFKEKLREAKIKALATELNHFKQCVANYPTDMSMKYEYGCRLLMAKKYDEAIPQFQEARNDPKLRVKSFNCIGQCFFHKGWFTDAIETFQNALELSTSTEDALAKEMRYNLGCAYQADNQIDEALACFRKIAQIDFNYRDVRNRIDAMRNQNK
ncbi:MAG: tetratricopeptide repeat protein [Sedimentisphaerales bacterium]|nr:tetratricopeptide repeat protein [Sedimentisphaerales bacterium]